MPYIGKEPARVPVTAADIPDDSITAAKIVDGVITAADIGANAVNTSELVDDAVTADKLANSINTEIAANTAKTGITSGQASAITANTAKVTNATHTGDVTGATALTIAAGAVDLAMLSATGTASSTTFLRGDNSWQTAGSTSATDLTSGTLPTARLPAGCILQVVAGELSATLEGSSDFDIMNVNITPKQADSDMLISVYVQWSILDINGTTGDDWGMELYRDSTSILGESQNSYFISGGGVDAADWAGQGSSSYGVNFASKMDLDTGRSSGTSQINYKLRMDKASGAGSKTIRFMRDGWGGGGTESQRSKCTIIVQEVAT